MSASIQLKNENPSGVTVSASHVGIIADTNGNLVRKTPAGSVDTLATRADQGVLNVKWYGAVGDGVADDTAAIQAALDASHASDAIVYFPKGSYITGSLNYRGQSMRGDGIKCTHILGKPSQDMFVLDAGSALYSRTNGIIENVEFKINDTVDASASFSTRSGIGNSVFSAAYNDANAAMPLSWHTFTFREVKFIGTTDVNTRKTCCFWSQRIVYNVKFDHCEFHTDYGFIIAAPANLSTTNTFGGNYDAFSNDHNTFLDCNFVCRTIAFQHINGQRCYVRNMQVYGGQRGALFIDFPNNNQNIATWIIDGLFVEGQTHECTRLQGGGHIFRGCTFSPSSVAATHGPLLIETNKTIYDHCTFYITGSYAGCNQITISAESVELMRCNLVPSTVVDNGLRNRISYVDWTDAYRPSAERILSKNKMFINAPDGGAAMLGAVGGRLIKSVNDLTIPPSDFQFNGPGTYTRSIDTSLEFGEKMTCTDYIYFSYAMGKQLKFGYDIPIGRVKLWMKVKRSVAGSVSRQFFITNATTSAAYNQVNVTYSNAWTIVSNEVDCSAASIGDIASPTFFCEGGGTTTDIAWIAIQPLPDEITGKKLLLPSITEPAPDDLHGGLVTWWDGTNFKAKKPNGTVVTIF